MKINLNKNSNFSQVLPEVRLTRDTTMLTILSYWTCGASPTPASLLEIETFNISYCPQLHLNLTLLTLITRYELTVIIHTLQYCNIFQNYKNFKISTAQCDSFETRNAQIKCNQWITSCNLQFIICKHRLQLICHFLQTSSSEYRLQAVIVHSGGIDSGHYVTFR